MKKFLTILILFITCFNAFSGFGADRYVYDNLISQSFASFLENDYRPNAGELIKALGDCDLIEGNKKYTFAVNRKVAAYNRLDIFVNSDGKIIKTLLYDEGEFIIVGKNDEWMNTMNIENGTFINREPVNDFNWFERQYNWAYEELVPSRETVDMVTPSYHTVLSTGVVILAVAPIVLFAIL